MHGVTKRFGAVTALESADLNVEHGVIHAVVGENGAGKTTLMRILYGAAAADSGSISVDGVPAHFRNSAQAIEAGIGMVSQHYTILPELTNLQNLMLGAEPGWLIRRSEAMERAQALADKMGFRFDWNSESSNLSPGEAQKLEILKLLWRKARIMILDEPTAMLSPAEGESLFASLGRLVKDGATAILVTHRLGEVMAHCPNVTVLRAGKTEAERPVKDVTAKELAELIVGSAVPSTAVLAAPLGDVRLGVSAISVRGYRGDLAVRGSSFEVRAGELIGIAGVDGNGQRELIQALIGLSHLVGGSISWQGNPVEALSVAKRLDLGFRLIPEDRHAEGLVEEWSLEENAALGLQRCAPFIQNMGPVQLIDRQGRAKAGEQITELLQTRCGGIQENIANLSGGNQQRFIAARALFLGAELILATQPARGLDIHGTEMVYERIRQLCREGACGLVVSFDLDELLEHCDRVVVMRDGRILEPDPSNARNRVEIGRLMVEAK